jgi:hypothetical protein
MTFILIKVATVISIDFSKLLFNFFSESFENSLSVFSVNLLLLVSKIVEFKRLVSIDTDKLSRRRL